MSYPKGKFMTVKAAIKKKTIHLTQTISGEDSGDGKLLAQLQEKWYTKKSAWKSYNFSGSYIDPQGSILDPLLFSLSLHKWFVKNY